jgi:hypothetical protein
MMCATQENTRVSHGPKNGRVLLGEREQQKRCLEEVEFTSCS